MTAPCAIEYILVTRWRGGKKRGQNKTLPKGTRAEAAPLPCENHVREDIFHDAHSCFRACVTIQNRRRPGTMNSNEIENVWPGLIMSEPYPVKVRF